MVLKKARENAGRTEAICQDDPGDFGKFLSLLLRKALLEQENLVWEKKMPSVLLY